MGAVTTWLIPSLFSLTYLVLGLYILSVAPDYYTRCEEDPVANVCSRCALRPHSTLSFCMP
jgi:hypothetical protein